MDIYKAIPNKEFELAEVPHDIIDEEMVLLCGERIVLELKYYAQKIPFATDKCLVRKSVKEKLLRVSEKLPSGYKLKVFDAWRPFEVQYALYLEYRKMVANENPSLGEEQIDFMTQQFVSMPKKEKLNAPVHTTGGAVDVTIVDESGNELDMGCGFDDFTEKANTAYYEKNQENDVAKNNRRMLYNLMISEGFSNLPSEWWHFDYGDNFWAHYMKEKAIYAGIFDLANIAF